MELGSGALSLRQYGASHGSHTHAHFQILWGLSGVLELEVRGRGSRIGVGQGCVIAPGEAHDFESRQGSRCLVLDSADPGWSRLEGTAPAASHMGALVRYLSEALAARDPVASLHGPGLLLQTWGGQLMQRDGGRARTVDWQRLSAWARWRLHEPLTVADLAAQSCLSPSQFAARCRQETGLSPMQWLRSLRLAHASALRSAGRSVAESALLSGYRSPSALTAALRRQEAGVSRSRGH